MLKNKNNILNIRKLYPTEPSGKPTPNEGSTVDPTIGVEISIDDVMVSELALESLEESVQGDISSLSSLSSVEGIDSTEYEGALSCLKGTSEGGGFADLVRQARGVTSNIRKKLLEYSGVSEEDYQKLLDDIRDGFNDYYDYITTGEESDSEFGNWLITWSEHIDKEKYQDKSKNGFYGWSNWWGTRTGFTPKGLVLKGLKALQFLENGYVPSDE